jgi:hypothetical protein
MTNERRSLIQIRQSATAFEQEPLIKGQITVGRINTAIIGARHVFRLWPDVSFYLLKG